jgi:hypothetical protein
VTIQEVLNWIPELLTTHTHGSELQAITAPSLTYTIHKSPQYTLSFSACCTFTNRSLAMASNSGYSSVSRVQIPSERRLPSKCAFLTDYCTQMNRFPQLSSLRTLCTDRVGNTFCNSTSIVACAFVVVGRCLPNCHQETNIVSGPFSSNGCLSVSMLFAFSTYATIYYFWHQGTQLEIISYNGHKGWWENMEPYPQAPSTLSLIRVQTQKHFAFTIN